MSDLNHYGKSGIITSDPGTLITDRTALATCTAVFMIKQSRWMELPDVGASHPIFTFIQMERRELSLRGAYAVASCSYAGIQYEFTQPVYELLVGLSDEPIETHIDFLKFAGTPKKPLNGAIFRDLKGNKVTAENPAQSDAGYVFDSFFVNVGGKLNKFAKVESYLESAQMTWKKTWNARASASDISKVGKIDSPDGGAPNLDPKRNWLNMGLSSTRRGSAYQMTMEWRASGRRGWIEEIYGK